jgi:transcriptional regulator with XRE-family HTH domain
VNTPIRPTSLISPLLIGLGPALRWLRERQGRKQYRVADDAGITKGMLSAYETGRQRPSLETLDKLLETLRADLNDLHNALQIVNGRPERMKGWSGLSLQAGAGAVAGAAGADIGAGGLGKAGDLGIDFRAARYPAIGSPRSGLAPLPPLPPSAGPRALSWPPGEVHEPPRAPYGARRAPDSGGGDPQGDLYRVLGLDQPRLAEEEELALGQMLDGFHGLLRYWHRSLASPGRRPPAEPDEDDKDQDKSKS